MIMTTARKVLFWSRDYLQGAPIHTHIQNIQQVSADASLLAQHQALWFLADAVN